MPKKLHILALIDGFNYYHKLKNYQKNNNACVKWLDYKSLINLALARNDNIELEIIYFSAIAYHRSNNAVIRHKNYINALKITGIKVILGEFKEKPIDICYNCKQKMPKDKIIKHEEKHTDVNIAITMLNKAYKNEFDNCYLLSEDNDYVPVIKMVKDLFPEKRIIICPPPQKQYSVDSLIKASKESDAYRFKWNQIKKSQFSDIFNGIENPWKI